jgi:hypothetical protein
MQMCGAVIVGWADAVSAHQFNGDFNPWGWQLHGEEAKQQDEHDTSLPTLYPCILPCFSLCCSRSSPMDDMFCSTK